MRSCHGLAAHAGRRVIDTMFGDKSRAPGEAATARLRRAAQSRGREGFTRRMRVGGARGHRRHRDANGNAHNRPRHPALQLRLQHENLGCVVAIQHDFPMLRLWEHRNEMQSICALRASMNVAFVLHADIAVRVLDAIDGPRRVTRETTRADFRCARARWPHAHSRATATRQPFSTPAG